MSHGFKQHFLAILTLLFITAQSFAVWHNAEYGSAEHKHQGKTCDVYVFAKNNTGDAPVAPVMLLAEHYFYKETPVFTVNIAPAILKHAHFGRAPPLPFS